MNKVYYITEGYFTEEEIRNEKTPLKAIKNYCRYSCCCNDNDAWKNCENENCFLWRFRMGKGVYKRVLSEEQRKMLSERMKGIGKNNKKE